MKLEVENADVWRLNAGVYNAKLWRLTFKNGPLTEVFYWSTVDVRLTFSSRPIEIYTTKNHPTYVPQHDI